MYGAMIGGMLLGLVETLLQDTDGNIQNMIAYIVLLIFLFVKPTGITNEKAIKDV